MSPLAFTNRRTSSSALAEDHPPFAGKYEVERILGVGGMATVFAARHVRLGHRVAIKVLGSELRERPELVERFEREARACGSLSSPHAVRVFDIDATEDGTPFIVMELLEGRDLSQILEREGPQDVATAVSWILQACDAVAEAHRRGIIHRDLKPSNLFLATVEGCAIVKVLDFGIAKRVSLTSAIITQDGAPLGTPQYMSPEQVRSPKDVDARADVWSLGVTLYELVTGATPFANECSWACIAAIAADPVPDPRLLRSGLTGEFVEVLMGALARDVDHRYQSVEALALALAPFAEAEALPVARQSCSAGTTYEVFSGAARPLRPAIAATRIRSGHWLAIAAASVLGLGVLGAAGWFAMPAEMASPVVGAAAPLASAGLSIAAPPKARSFEVAAAPVVTEVIAPPQPIPRPVAAVDSSRPSRIMVARPLVSALAPAASVPEPVRRPAVVTRPSAVGEPVAVRATLVHGGLSSPGF